MSQQKTIKRLITCFGSIQLITVLSVLNFKEKEQQNLNFKYENYLVITPLLAPQGQNEQFAAFIERMARSVCSWEKIVYIPSEQKLLLAKKLKRFGLAKVSELVHKLLDLENADEIYLSHAYNFEDQLLMNIYESAEKICYGNGIGIYTAQSAFPSASSLRNLNSYLNSLYITLKNNIKLLLPQKNALSKQEFDIGYFSLPSAFDQSPQMKTVILDKSVYLETFLKFKETLSSLIDVNYINDFRTKLRNAPISILLTSNFSEVSGRMSLENEITAYRAFLQAQGILEDSILLIKPHPRDSNLKIQKLKSALSDLYSDTLLLSEVFFFYLPFEIFFLEVFLNPEAIKLQFPRIFTFSSACLTLELILNVQCTVGFGSNIVKKFFYADHVDSRIEHEADLLSTIQEIRNSNSALV